MQPKAVNGARVLLFDRLIDQDPGAKKENRPYRVYDRQQLMQSVMTELSRLLNTRRNSSEPLSPGRATVLDYGVPDFASFNAASPTERERLKALIESTIMIFEPRIANPHVEFVEAANNRQSLTGTIYGSLRIGLLTEPVSFPVVFRAESGDIEILSPPMEESAPR
jgi:type VI secretion system lysozyme-related protein